MKKVEQNDIKHGGIYLVEKDIYASFEVEGKFKKKGLRTMIIPKGELLEFRYHSPCHFRDLHNQYFWVDDRQLGKLKHVAQIWDKVFRNNIAELEDILRLKLYDEVNNPNPNVYRVNQFFLDRALALKSHFEEKEITV